MISSIISKKLVQSAPKAIASNSFINSGRSFYTYTNEPSHAIPGKKPKLVSAAEAVSVVKSNDVIFIQGAAATPRGLVPALAAHGKSKNLKNVKIHHIHTEGAAEYNEPDMSEHFRSNSLFTGANCRKAIAEGRADYTPIYLSEIPLLFHRGLIKPDVALVQVTPVDKHGYHSLGTSVDTVRAALKQSKHIIGQVNKHVPRTQGDALIHESHFDSLVQDDIPLHELKAKPLTDVEKAIGKHIAENLVEDGSTLQMGIGAIPDAVLAQLTNHKDLGVHSEMFSDGVVDLFNLGCITNRFKVVEPGKIVSSFLNGTKKLYDFADDNPFLTMRVIDWVNKEFIIAQNPKIVAINSCIEIDLVGQVCADTIGTRVYSGFGGQVDFLRGAALANDGLGKPILAMASTTSRGESKIVPLLKPGAGVVTNRASAHYIVTEHGIAYLFGKSLRQRAHALINIAHPDHRQALEKAAFDRLKCMPTAD